jgi:o-succinylbenzoate synthase
VRVCNLDWTMFRLPFRRQFATAHTTFSHRQGVLVRLTTDVGIVGLGEASPLLRDGEGALPEVLAMLASAKTALIGKRVDEIDADLRWSGRDRCAAAAVCCALDTAVCDVMAKAAGVTTAELLTPNMRRSIAVNATIGASSTTAACKAALQASAAGFACVKLKVGMTQDLEEEYERVATVRAALGPQVKLRLDVNGAWSVEQAIRTIRVLERYDLEFVEQPVRPGGVESMRRVREAVRTPIAADEDITDLDAARRVLQLGAAQILVLKPMVVGGLRPARRIIELAQAAGVAVVVTTTLDAGVGTAAALHLAATLPPGGHACGLATGDLLASDLLICPLAVNGGHMQLPEGSGLGVELDIAKLQGYSGDKGKALR